MAPAVLASRNEPHWRDSEAYMRRYTSVTAATNANKSRNGASHSHGDLLPGRDPNPSPSPIQLPSSLQSSSQIRNPSGDHRVGRMLPPSRPKWTMAPGDEVKESYRGGYVTFNLDAHSGLELKELRKRLQSELEQVRTVRTRLDRLHSESRPVYPSFQFSNAHTQHPLALPAPGFPSRIASGTKANQQNRAIKGPKSKKIFPILVPGQGSKPSSPSTHELEPYSLQDKVLVSMMRRCGQILGKVMKHRSAVWFNHPVDVVGMRLFDYSKVIKRPMDLGTVKSNLDDGVYKAPFDFASDVRLTFSNAMTYNPIGHEVHGFAKQLLKFFDDMFEPSYKRFEAEQRKVSRQSHDMGQFQPALLDRAVVSHQPVIEAMDTDVEEVARGVIEQQQQQQLHIGKAAVMQQQQLRGGKLPKPKAKDANKRAMSAQEKEKLGKELQELPPEKMDQVVQIVRKRNGELEQEDNEIVLDFDAMDVETLWELDRLVTNYRKCLNKMKRQEQLQLQNQLEENKFITQGPETSPEMARNKIVEEEVDIGEESPVGNYPPVEIEKDLIGCGSGSGSGKSSSSGGSRSSSRSGSSSSSGLFLFYSTECVFDVDDSGSESASGSESDEDSVQSPCVKANDAGNELRAAGLC
ncbi:unnamed protein product [Linum tenue]|uniref:Uncharacterized protein n=1 Tax=Linum tenue TaxID=586396 RepID=A0AAV0LBU4_9ROSI|nr:unnamed protein product [Linum tenue]